MGKINPAEGLFDMLEAEDAYVPTRGREKDEPLPTGQQKGGRT